MQIKLHLILLQLLLRFTYAFPKLPDMLFLEVQLVVLKPLLSTRSAQRRLLMKIIIFFAGTAFDRSQYHWLWPLIIQTWVEALVYIVAANQQTFLRSVRLSYLAPSVFFTYFRVWHFQLCVLIRAGSRRHRVIVEGRHSEYYVQRLKKMN